MTNNSARTIPDAQLDLRGTPCPINFVRTKLRLEQMEPGSLLEVWLDPGEPIEQVPDSLTMAGYQVEQIEERASFFALQVRQNRAGEQREAGEAFLSRGDSGSPSLKGMGIGKRGGQRGRGAEGQQEKI
jgi:TusA-related sulfurtransferase